MVGRGATCARLGGSSGGTVRIPSRSSQRVLRWPRSLRRVTAVGRPLVAVWVRPLGQRAIHAAVLPRNATLSALGDDLLALPRAHRAMITLTGAQAEMPRSFAMVAISQAVTPTRLWALSRRAFRLSLGLSWQSLSDLSTLSGSAGGVGEEGRGLVTPSLTLRPVPSGGSAGIGCLGLARLPTIHLRLPSDRCWREVCIALQARAHWRVSFYGEIEMERAPVRFTQLGPLGWLRWVYALMGFAR